MNASTMIIILILIVIIVLAVKSSILHMRGQGGCCGGDVPKVKKKRLENPIVSTKIITIEGMHCENCKNRVEKSINSLDDAVCKVNLKQNTAIVSMSSLIDDETLKSTIENLDFKVIEIKSQDIH
ncbi:MAG: heavy-metal-associated domain-containing protein [Oscillospiraceae bacterium]